MVSSHSVRYAGQTHCKVCSKAYADHSPLEALACEKEESAEVAMLDCPTCGRMFGQHTEAQLWGCARKRREKGKG